MMNHQKRTDKRSRPTVIFLHIPKTAGTTLDQIIARNYRAQEVFGTGLVAQAGLERFKSLPPAQKARIRLVKGHMDFGLHEFVPGPSAYFTFLREPIDRAISHYYFIRRTPRHPAHPYVLADNLDLKATLERGLDGMLFNAHVRLLSGVWHELHPGQCTEEHLALAKKRLREHFTVVGLTEEFDATLLLLKRAFGWQHLFYTKRNVTRRRPAPTALPAQTRAALVEANRLDLELYAYAQTLFAEQAALHDDLSRELAWFRLRNRFLQPALRAYWRLRRYSVRAMIRQRLGRSTDTL